VRSPRARLVVLWLLSLTASVGAGFLLVRLWEMSASAQVARAAAEIAHACDLIGQRYAFYSVGWSGPVPPFSDKRLRQDLTAAMVRARVWGEVPAIPGDRTVALKPDSAQARLWQGICGTTGLADGPHALSVQAKDAAGLCRGDTVKVPVSRNGCFQQPRRYADGSDRNAMGPWPERHILGAQPGPNRNGRQC
jgi:hypothetical protein